MFEKSSRPADSTVLNLAKKCLMVLIGLLVAVLSIVVWQQTSHKSGASPKATAKTVINDKNYSITLPLGWLADGSYVSGSGLGVFVDGSSGSDKTRLVVFVSPASEGISAKTHADNEIAALKKNDSTFRTIEDRTVQFGKNKTIGRVLTVQTGRPSDPNNRTYHVYAYLTNESTIYNLDATVPAGSWGEQSKAVYAALESFEPIATTVNRAIE
jgi:hypothetical protein